MLHGIGKYLSPAHFHSAINHKTPDYPTTSLSNKNPITIEYNYTCILHYLSDDLSSGIAPVAHLPFVKLISIQWQILY